MLCSELPWFIYVADEITTAEVVGPLLHHEDVRVQLAAIGGVAMKALGIKRKAN